MLKQLKILSFGTLTLFPLLLGAVMAPLSVDYPYPDALEQGCHLFSAKCSTCHAIKLSLQSEYILPSYWKKIVQEMAEKPHSNIQAEEIPTIYEFLVYDSATRRKRQLDDAMSNASDAKRAVYALFFS
jgi:hypothetical protein